MSILIDNSTRAIVQGGTGAYGAAQVAWMRASGTQVVGYVSPGRGGTMIDGTPVFDLMDDAVRATGANSSIIYVPAAGVRDAIVENADAGIKVAVVIAELVPAHDTLWAVNYARSRNLWIVGPNTVGISSPGQSLLGSIPADFTKPGPVGVISRSGTLGLVSARLLTHTDCGQSTIACVGGDAISGRLPSEYLDLFLHDDSTEVVAYIGEIGGLKEYQLLDQIKSSPKPVVAAIVGRHAPAGKRMGHAGALVGENRETAAAKRAALKDAGAIVVDNLADLATQVRRQLDRVGASSNV